MPATIANFKNCDYCGHFLCHRKRKKFMEQFEYAKKNPPMFWRALVEPALTGPSVQPTDEPRKEAPCFKA
jgi:hypothetical protein